MSNLSVTMEDQREYYLRRARLGCSNCTALESVDAISQLCPPCKKHLIVHGSPSVKKPSLQKQIYSAHLLIDRHCNIDQASEVFDRFMLSYASSSRGDLLRRLCWLHFIQLKTSTGDQLMCFRDTLVQTLAVTMYEQAGGVIDNKRKQYQYLLGRASVCPWNQRKQCKQGTIYDKEERRDIQRKPTLFHRAFNEIFIGAGLARFISQLNKKNKRQ